jgi:outer membrane protein
MLARVRTIGRAALAAAVLGPGAAAAETLTDALVRAYETSHVLDSNQALLRARDENVAQALSALRPIISFVSRTTDSDTSDLTSTVSLTLDLLLYDFGATPLGVEVQKENVLAGRAALVEAEQQVLLNAVSAYMNMRREAQFVNLNENNVRLIAQELQAARDRFEVGEITQTDVSLAQARLAQARSELVLAQGNLEIARAQYNLAIGAYPGQLQPPPPAPSVPATLEAAIAVATQGHPSIARAQHVVRAGELNVLRAEAQMKPTISLGGSINHTSRAPRGFDRDSAQADITMRIPLYQGGRLSSVYRQAIANLDSSRSDLLQVSTEVANSVARAWAQLEVATATITARQQQIQAATLAYRGVREEATLGSRTTLDVLDAEQELLNARANLVDAERNRYVGVYSLLSAMGLLTVDHLGLPTQRFDPRVYYNTVRNAPSSTPRGAKLDRILKKTGRN